MATTAPRTHSSAGTTIAIASGAPATYDETGFEAQTFKVIGKIKNGGEFGKQFQVITNQYLSQRGDEKRKGTFNAGQLNLQVDRIDEEGQLLAETALDSDADYSLRVVLQSGKTYYMRGLVTSFKTSIGGANDMTSGTIAVELNPIFTTGGLEVAAVMVPAP